jgi:hypothetical protein
MNKNEKSGERVPAAYQGAPMAQGKRFVKRRR